MGAKCELELPYSISTHINTIRTFLNVYFVLCMRNLFQKQINQKKNGIAPTSKRKKVRIFSDFFFGRSWSKMDNNLKQKQKQSELDWIGLDWKSPERQ